MNLRNTTERTLHRFAVLNRFAAATTFLERSRGHEGRALRWIPGLVLIWHRLRAAGLDNGLSVPNQLGYTSIREPMITVRSRGRPKCFAAAPHGNRALRDQPASCRAALVSAGTYSISSLCSGRWASALTASV